MYSKLKKWWDSSPQPQPASAQPAPRADSYSPDLISNLQAEHRELLALFEEMTTHAQGGDDAACRAAFMRFSETLRNHLLRENRQLYGYFARYDDAQPADAECIETMSTEMLRIGKALHHFISFHTRSTWTAAHRPIFLQDMSNIGALLIHRIEQEEKVLYPLYRPGVAAP